jgi:hypothetical protein
VYSTVSTPQTKLHAEKEATRCGQNAVDWAMDSVTDREHTLARDQDL